jgi:hypothetical protein
MATILWMSGEIQGDVHDEYRLARQDIESSVNAVFSSFDYGDGLVKWYVIPTILEKTPEGYGEINRYVKKERSFESRPAIPHAEFKAADAAGKRMLIIRGMLLSLDKFRRRKIPGIDFAKIESDLRELAAAKGWV